MPKRIDGAASVTARVLSQECKSGGGAGSAYCVLCLEAPPVRATARPGQFLMVRPTAGTDPLLGRPLAVFDLPDDTPGAVEIMYATVGRGTRMLRELTPGDEIPVLGPLGSGWRVPGDEDKAPVLLVGGGCGVAALYLLAAELAKSSRDVTLVSAGADSSALLPEPRRERLVKLGVRVELATEDGSAGRQGLATGLADDLLDEGAGDGGVYCAGPTGMMKALREIVKPRNIRMQASLEARMACGVGVCRGCVVRATTPHPETGLFTRTVCADGPVFDADEVDWEALG